MAAYLGRMAVNSGKPTYLILIAQCVYRIPVVSRTGVDIAGKSATGEPTYLYYGYPKSIRYPIETLIGQSTKPTVKTLLNSNQPSADNLSPQKTGWTGGGVHGAYRARLSFCARRKPRRSGAADAHRAALADLCGGVHDVLGCFASHLQQDFLVSARARERESD